MVSAYDVLSGAGFLLLCKGLTLGEVGPGTRDAQDVLHSFCYFLGVYI